MMRTGLFTAIMALLPLLISSQVLNIERERIKTDTTGWSGTATLSLNMISNIQKFTQIGIGAHLQYKTKRSLYLALSDYEMIKSEKDDFSNKGMEHFRYNYKINKVLTYEAFAQAQFNKVLNLKFRGLTGTGLRLKILGLDNFRIYTGSAYMYEYEVPEKEGNIESNHRISGYLSLTVKFGEGFSLINTTYIQPRVDNFNDYRLSNHLDFVLKISKHLSYALSYEYLDDSRPIAQVPGNIYSFRNKLLLDFGN